MRSTCLTSLFVIALAALSQCAGASPGAVDVVRDGQPAASVVLGEQASAQLNDAVKVLVACVEESTGAALPVLAEAPQQGNVIFVGPSSPVEAWSIGVGELDDGYLIALPDQRSVVILGRTDWGTEFGIYEFLERYAGVRWLMPGADGTDVPAHKTTSVQREPVRHEHRNACQQRQGMSAHASTPTSAAGNVMSLRTRPFCPGPKAARHLPKSALMGYTSGERRRQDPLCWQT